MASPAIRWSYFPRSIACPDFLVEVVEVSEAAVSEIHSAGNVGQASNEALAKLRPGLEALGFAVESGKTASQKIHIPVLYGANGKVEKAFEADAYHRNNAVVVEVEAGRGVTNYQFLKDLFQACVMPSVDYLVIAVRQDYRGSDDYSKVVTFIETLYASSRLVLPLKGIQIIGY
jgi:hypothetical protein